MIAKFACWTLRIHQSFDEFGGEVDAVRPCNRVHLQGENLKGIDVSKLLHDGAVVRLDDAFEISDKTASVVEFDGYLVIANIFRVSHMKHSLDQHTPSGLTGPGADFVCRRLHAR